MQNEQFVKIKKFPNYLISNLGRVYSIKRKKILKPFINNCGYVMITLYNDLGSKKFTIHNLVAEHFLNKEKENLEVNHKDENKLNNCVENLEYLTHKENSQYSFGKKIMTSNEEYFPSIGEASRVLKISKTSIIRSLKNGNKCKNRIFTYIN